MKNITVTLAIILLLISSVFAVESNIKMTFGYGTDSADLLSILRFENIDLYKVSFKGSDLKDKHFKITIKEFTDGKLVNEKVALDSKELGDLGIIKSDTFSFRTLSRRTLDNTAKFQFQFDRFHNEQVFKINENYKGFVMKSFLGANPEMPMPVNESKYFLTFMMPYMKPDGSGAYCEVAQSGANPEEFGLKYKIPTYFLIDIKFQ